MRTLTAKLKENNLKVTPQRLAIYNYLVNTNKHPSAEMVYNEIKDEFPSMSLATVYKTLSSLTLAKLIQELNVGEDSYRYDANIEFHPHIICTDCHQVYDYYTINPLQQLKSDIEAETGFSIQSEQIYFFGKCKNCIDKK